MKKSTHVISAVALLFSFAPVVIAAPDVPAAATQAVPADEQTAINRYIFTNAAVAMEIMADSMDVSDGSLVSNIRIIVKGIASSLETPLDGLPAKHQDFLRESKALNKGLVDELNALLEQVEAGSIPESDITEKMEVIYQAKKAELDALEARYPESAAILGSAASERMVHELVPELEEAAMPHVQAYFEAHPEERTDPAHVMAVCFRVIGGFFREKSNQQ